MARQVKDAATRAKLMSDYDFGCKRPTFSNTYFPTFNRDNVHHETTAIDHIDHRVADEALGPALRRGATTRGDHIRGE